MDSKKKWVRGIWKVSAEVAPMLMDSINEVTQRGIEVRHEDAKQVIFCSYHPYELWPQEKAQVEMRVELLLSLLSDAFIDCEWEEFYEENWQQNWQQYFRPQRISNQLIVLPVWEKYQPKESEIAIFIKPGMAFGTGTHETTKLCLKVMERLFPKEQPQSLLDVGTGSGILAIYAAKLGIKNIVGLDTDPLAIEEAVNNAKINQVSHIQFFQGTVTLELPVFDWVVANLETHIILPLLDKLLRVTKKTLILSGILDKDLERVKSSLRRPCRYMEQDGEWVCLVC